MRVRKPWFRKSKNAWFVEKDGRQIRLAVGRENEKAATQAFYKLMAGQSLAPSGPTVLVATIFDLFLDFSKARHTAESYQHYRHFLNDFCQKWGTLQVAVVKAFHVTRWLDDRPSWKGSRRSAIIAVKRGFSWAEQEGLIPSNPIKHVKKPPAKSRKRVITTAEKDQILAAIPDEGFRSFVVAMQESGCRPGEIAAITAENFDHKLGVWVLQQHKTSAKTGKPRIVYLTPTLRMLTERLITKFPTGPLFRNRRGKAFSRNSIRCRFRRIREKHPNLAGIVAYSYRHSFATNALVRGVGVAQVAELLGHTSTDMVMKHYSHVADNVEHMRKAAEQAAGFEISDPKK